MSDQPMTKQQAEQYQRELALLWESHVQDEDRQAHSDCSLNHGTPRTAQEKVAERLVPEQLRVQVRVPQLALVQ